MNLVGLAARNVLRNKVRTSLTIVGVAVAVLTFMLLRTLVYAWTGAQDYAAKDRVVTRHKVTFVMTLPHKYLDETRAISGVKTSTFATWFGGKDPKHDKEFFAALAVETDSFFDVYSEMKLPPEALTAWKEDRSGAIIGDVLAKKLGVKVGDKMILQSGIYPPPGDSEWTFNIVGIYTATAKSVDRSTFMFHWKYLNEALPAARQDQIGWIVSRVTDPTHTADIGVAVDRHFDERDIQTLSQDERAFNASFLAGISAILTAVDIVSVVILIIMLLILGNTIAMGVRERTSEYGTLRAIGFMPKHVTLFIVSEALVIGLLGAGLGILIAYPFIEQGLGRWLEENMGSFFPYFRIHPLTTVAALLLGLGLAGLASVLPALGASRLRVVDALRRVA